MKNWGSLNIGLSVVCLVSIIPISIESFLIASENFGPWGWGIISFILMIPAHIVPAITIYCIAKEKKPYRSALIIGAIYNLSILYFILST